MAPPTTASTASATPMRVLRESVLVGVDELVTGVVATVVDDVDVLVDVVVATGVVVDVVVDEVVVLVDVVVFTDDEARRAVGDENTLNTLNPVVVHEMVLARVSMAQSGSCCQTLLDHRYTLRRDSPVLRTSASVYVTEKVSGRLNSVTASPVSSLIALTSNTSAAISVRSLRGSPASAVMGRLSCLICNATS
jgi:hypothetical protein